MRRLTMPLLFALVLAGCAGGGAVMQEPSDEGPEDVPTLAEQEDFDVGAYPDRPAEVRVDVEHDVPAVLRENRADEGLERVVQGFRVQVVSTTDADESLELEEEVRRYWRSIARGLAPDNDLPRDPAVYRIFRQPYYRIRLGDFVDRTAADEAARRIASYFPGAFVVPDQVTVE